MYLPRSMDGVLAEWRTSADRKPLILRGARQTGKSTTIREFGRAFSLFLEINLERHADLALVRSCHDIGDFLSALMSRHNLRALPDNTLIFIDEIQESPEAVGWLRFLKEDHSELAVIAAGSLLEVRLQGGGFSFPVGRVTFRTLRPLGFREFLVAMNRSVLVEKLHGHLMAGQPAPMPLHDEAMRLLREYLLIGGMPEAVARWSQERNPVAVQEVHADLTQAFAEDFHRYGSLRTTEHLEAAFSSLQHHYGRRFTYENFAPGHKSLAMKTAIDRLEGALLITRVWPSASLQLPLKRHPKSAPKLLPLDTGLALFSMGLDRSQLRDLPLEEVLDGRLAEMFVGQQLLGGRPDRQEQLFFWIRESSHAGAEVDYLLPGVRGPVPVEVKAGAAGRLKSLHQFLWRSGRRTGIRLGSGPYRDATYDVAVQSESLRYRLLDVPIYLAEAVWELLSGMEQGI